MVTKEAKHSVASLPARTKQQDARTRPVLESVDDVPFHKCTLWEFVRCRLHCSKCAYLSYVFWQILGQPTRIEENFSKNFSRLLLPLLVESLYFDSLIDDDYRLENAPCLVISRFNDAQTLQRGLSSESRFANRTITLTFQVVHILFIFYAIYAMQGGRTEWFFSPYFEYSQKGTVRAASLTIVLCLIFLAFTYMLCKGIKRDNRLAHFRGQISITTLLC